jgi:hypothetical protein
MNVLKFLGIFLLVLFALILIKAIIFATFFFIWLVKLGVYAAVIGFCIYLLMTQKK